MKVEIIDIRLLQGDKPLKAFVDIKLDGSQVIREWRVIDDKGKRLRVAPPQLSWKAPDGQIQYKTIVTFPDDQKGTIDFAVLKAFIEEMEKSDAKKQ